MPPPSRNIPPVVQTERRASLTLKQISDVELTYPGSGRRHSPVTPLGRVMYRQHISVHGLVTVTGIKRQNISNYLCGDRPIRNRTHLDAFARVLDCRVVDLLSPADARHWNVTLPDDATWFVDMWPVDPSREDGVR